MLIVGFYLLNIGFVLLRMRTSSLIVNFESMIVYLSSSIGFVLVVLGAFHFINMILIHKFRESSLKKESGNKPKSDNLDYTGKQFNQNY